MDNSTRCEENNESNQTGKKDQNHRKKEQFRGSRLNQKTLVDSSMDKDADEESDLEPEDQNIPLIVEDLVPSTDESENDAKTEHSDVPVTVEDKREIDDEHETPMFYGRLKSSASLQSIKQQSRDEAEFEGRNTSDEELPELLPDKTRSVSRQKKKRRVIRRQDEKEYSSDGTDTSDLVVTDKEYYSIRHETEYHIETKTEFIVSENEDERLLKQDSNQAEEEEKIEEDNDDVDTETSDLEVTNKEYYTIRHETEFSERKEKEFIILFSPKKNVIQMQSCEEASNLGDPWTPALDLFRAEDEKDDETSDDDISCNEDDFMTFDEFMEAHKTYYNFKIGSKDKVTSDIKFKELEVLEDDSTESLRESPIPDKSLADLDRDTEEEQENDFSETNSTTAAVPEENFSIEFMNHNQIDGVIAVVTKEKSELDEPKTQHQYISVDGVATRARDDFDTDTEELENSEYRDQMQTREDETDEENLSDFTEDSEVLSITREYKLAERMNGTLRISSSIDGDQVTVETSCEIKENSQDQDQETKTSYEEEVFECLQTNPQEEAEVVEEFDLNDLKVSLSRVSFQEKRQIINKKKRYHLQTVKTEEL